MVKVVKLCSCKPFKLRLADARENNKLLRLQMHYFHAIKRYLYIVLISFVTYLSHINIEIFTGTDGDYVSGEIGNTQ